MPIKKESLPMPAPTPEIIDLANLADWSIVVAADAGACEHYAAEELQLFYLQAGGGELPITTNPGRKKRLILLGVGAATLAGTEIDIAGLGSEGYRLIIRDEQIIIAGGSPRGTLYGVYSFLEDELGVRFLTAEHTHVPRLGTSRPIIPVDRSYSPPFEFRWPYYYETNNNPVMATRQRTNTVQTDLEHLNRPFMRHPPVAQDGRAFCNDDPKFGGVTDSQLVGHSFYLLLPAKEFARSHPEYYCEVAGRRLALETLDDIHRLQPCLTSPAVLEIVTQRVLAPLAADPSRRFIIVGQNDNRNYCQCAACRALDQAEDSAMGSLLSFVNAVAESVAMQYPDVVVGTLAYQHTRKPPRNLRPRANVQIQLCSIECCTMHALDDPGCPANAPFMEELKAWGKLTRRIGIWTYLTNFQSYLSPFPNLEALERNVRCFAANHVSGLFMQAVYDTPGGEMSDLKNYLIASLLWNPVRNLHDLRDEFLDRHYGQAAPPIRAYLDRLHASALAKHLHQNCFGRDQDYGIDQVLVQYWLDQFARALELAETEAVRRRVEKASLCALRAALEPVLRSTSPISPEQARHCAPLLRQFFALCKTYHVTKIRESSVPEWRPVAAEIRQLESIVADLKTRLPEPWDA
jgi:hypothetical protein